MNGHTDAPLAGKTVIVPGASRPIGRAIARRFARAGASLVLPHHDWPESVAEMQQEFRTLPAGVLDCSCDLRDAGQVEKLRQLAEQRFPTIDILINNIERGGMPVIHGSYGKPWNLEQWQLEFDTTVKAKHHLFHAFLPLLRLSGDGSVVNISSIAAAQGRSGPAAPFFSDGYSAANRALGVLTDTWARQAAPEVRVNELMLGLIASRHGPGTRGWQEMDETMRARAENRPLLRRFGSPEEVATAAYLLAVEMTYATGSTLVIDGGYCLGGNEVPPLPEGVLGKVDG